MALFWIVHEIDGERRVSIQEGSTLNFARLDAVIAGVEGASVQLEVEGERRSFALSDIDRARLVPDV